MQHLARARFELVAAEVLIFLLHVSVAIENVVAIGHRVLELDELVMQIAEAAAAGDRFIEDGASGHFVNFLTKMSNGDFLRNRDHAVVSGLFAGDHAKERRFSGAIRSDEAGLLARIELERGFDEEDLPPVLLVNVRKRNHSRA